MNLRKTKSNFLNLKFFLKSTRPSLPLKKAPPLFPSPFSHGEGWLHSAIWKRTFIALICTTFPLRVQGMCQPPYSELFFRKPTRPSLPLRKAPHLSPSLSLLRRERMCQPPYSVLKPLRYMVGGPSEVYASSGAADFCAGMDPLSLKDLIKGCLLVAFFENLPILP